MGQKNDKPVETQTNKPANQAAPIDEVKRDYFGNLYDKSGNIDNNLEGYGTFCHSYSFEITGEFSHKQVVGIKSIEFQEQFIDYVFEFDRLNSDDDLLAKAKNLMKTDSPVSVNRLINGKGIMTRSKSQHPAKPKILDRTCGWFVNGEIEEGDMTIGDKFSFTGKIKNYVPVKGVISAENGIFKGDIIGVKDGNYYLKGMVEYGDEKYEGRLDIYGNFLWKDGFGVLHKAEETITGKWNNNQLCESEPHTIEYKNGLVKKVEEKTTRLMVRINLSDFSFDMQKMSEFFKEPPKIEFGKPTYELSFEGKTQKNFPKSGSMRIYKVFKLTDATWDDNGELQGAATLSDPVNQKLYELNYTDGVECTGAIKQTIEQQTAAIPEFHEEEGQAPDQN